MLNLNDLKPNEGSSFSAKRIGRGGGSGTGCTAGKGNNGAWTRTGHNYKPYFEGGQTPHTRRLPKRGFNHPSKVTFQIVNLSEIAAAITIETEIDIAWLRSKSLVLNLVEPVKVLGNGEFGKKVTIKASAFSKSALAKIESAEGKAEVVAGA